MGTSRKEAVRQCGRWLLLACWIGVILAIGGTTAFAETGAIVRWLLRKSVHILEYGVLGFLLWWTTADRTRDRGRWQVSFGVAMAIVIAGLDEWRQTRIAGRAGELADVGLDAVGGTLGVAVAWLWHNAPKGQ